MQRLLERNVAETCCKYPGVTQCMMKSNSSMTSPLYAVGSGELENISRLNITAVNRPHPPVVSG